MDQIWKSSALRITINLVYKLRFAREDSRFGFVFKIEDKIIFLLTIPNGQAYSPPQI
jgi:hypothetical protein